MKILVGLGLAILVYLSGQYLFFRKEILVGDPAPNFSYTNLKGEHRDLADFSGKYIILSFWGSWCGPCRESNRKLREFYAARAYDDLEIISVGVEEQPDDWEKARTEDSLFWDEQFTSLKMFEDETVKKYAIKETPSYFLLGPDRTILSADGDIEAIIRKYLQQKS